MTHNWRGVAVGRDGQGGEIADVLQRVDLIDGLYDPARADLAQVIYRAAPPMGGSELAQARYCP